MIKYLHWWSPCTCRCFLTYNWKFSWHIKISGVFFTHHWIRISKFEGSWNRHRKITRNKIISYRPLNSYGRVILYSSHSCSSECHPQTFHDSSQPPLWINMPIGKDQDKTSTAYSCRPKSLTFKRQQRLSYNSHGLGIREWWELWNRTGARPAYQRLCPLSHEADQGNSCRAYLAYRPCSRSSLTKLFI